VERDRERQVVELEWGGKCKDLQTQLELAAVQREEVEEAVRRLQQEARDGVEERKISEKKGHAMVKDLKRQLQAERRRTEQLQERLREWAETCSNVSDPPPAPLESDRSSISSWSLMSGQGEGPSSSSPIPSTPSPEDTPSTTLEKENEALMGRVAGLQQEKWALEERLVMLEQSGAAMAEELVTKSELVRQYCVGERRRVSSGERRVGGHHSTVQQVDSPIRKLMKEKLDRLVKPDSVQHAKEVSSMQGMLEETLTKNLHLQQDLEHMAQEMVRMSKLAGSPAK